MTENKLKIFAIIVGSLSLIQASFQSLILLSILFLNKQYLGQVLFGNFFYSYLLLSPLSVIGLLVASIGLFYLKHWGFILANISLAVFIGGLLIGAVGTIFPNLLDFSVKLTSDKYISFLPTFNLEAGLYALIAMAALLTINLKSTRLILK